MAAKATRIIIPLTGIATAQSKPRAVYDELSSKVMAAIGPVETQRASNVEPGSALSQQALKVLGSFYTVQDGDGFKILDDLRSHWFADMTPCGLQIVLGPYAPSDREIALREEVECLQNHNCPTCESCTARQQQTEPNTQHLTDQVRRVPADLTLREIMEIDLSKIELSMLHYYRTRVADIQLEVEYAQRFVGMPELKVQGHSEWTVDGNTYSCIVMVAAWSHTIERKFSVTFADGTCTIIGPPVILCT